MLCVSSKHVADHQPAAIRPLADSPQFFSDFRNFSLRSRPLRCFISPKPMNSLNCCVAKLARSIFCEAITDIKTQRPTKPNPLYQPQSNTVMKLTYALILAAASCGMAFGAATAYTTPVGYYQYAGIGGGNMFVPGLVQSAAFAGQLTGATSTTLTVAANSLTADAFDKGAVYAAYYVEITSGPNAGVALDILSNTTSVITLMDDVSALSLTGTESIKIRPHVTLKSVLSNAEALLNPYTDTATFYAVDGSFLTYFYGGDGGTGWSSDFATADGNLRPIPPGTGFVLQVLADVSLTVTGEVKTGPSVVMLGGGVVNIVGPVNPLVGTTTSLNNTGFGALAAYTDSITVYQPGLLSVFVTYFPLGDGTISSDFVTSTTDIIVNTTGAVVIPAVNSSVSINSGFTVAP